MASPVDSSSQPFRPLSRAMSASAQATATVTARPPSSHMPRPRPPPSAGTVRSNVSARSGNNNAKCQPVFRAPTPRHSAPSSEKSTCIVLPQKEEDKKVKRPPSPPPPPPPEPVTPAPPAVSTLPLGAAIMLAKFKPFKKDSHDALKIRIAERKRIDDEKARKRETEESRLVDGELVGDDDEDLLQTDPKMAEGKSLPKVVANHFPKHLLGSPVEDIDPRQREYDETFLVISRRFNKTGYIYRFSATPSLYIFRPWSPLRRLALFAYTHPIFDIIVIFTILANSLSMAMNISETVPEYTFLAIYTLEGIIKAISRGVILNKHGYLREGWNWLDFIVLVSAYATIIAQYASSGGSSVNIQALRTFRVFRVLKTIAIIPGLKTIIEALMRALKMLGDVLIMTIFFFTIFALFGLQLFQGTLLSKCVLNADSVGVTLTNGSAADAAIGPSWSDWVGNSSNWSWQDNGLEYQICANVSGAQQCPTNYTCIQVSSSPGPNSDFTKFDNFYSSFMIAVQIFNTDYWDFMYHDALAANGPVVFLFFIVAVVFLTYYLSNLVQAVVALSYQVEEDEDEEDDDVGTTRKKVKRRFVFDPYKLRNVQREGEVRSRSLISVKNVTEKRLGSALAPHVGNGALPIDDEDDVPLENETGRPIAVVKPQKKLSIATPNHHRHVNMSTPGDSHSIYDDLSDQIPHSLQVASRPPSAVSNDRLPEIGFWDRNPLCCFKCCQQSAFFVWLRIQSGIMTVVTDPFFELAITVAIVVNTVSMAAVYYDMPIEAYNALSIVNDVCTYIFITEAVLKLSALCGEYFVNRWNWLDFAVVIGSLIDIVFSNVNVSIGGFNIQIIRLLRLLRILKLAQSWKTMRMLLEIILGTFGAIGNLMLVLMIVIFIFAVIGMQLFGGTYTEDVFQAHPTYTPFPGFTGIPEWNWDDFFHAFMLVFRILCRESYQPMFDCISANGAGICVPFYLATLIVGSYVVLNLFLAVLLNAFSADDLKKKSKDAEESRLRKRMKKVTRFIKRITSTCFTKCCPGLSKRLAAVAPAPEPAGGNSVAGGSEFDRTTIIQDPEGDDRSVTTANRKVKLNAPSSRTSSRGRQTEGETTSIDASSTTGTHTQTGRTSHTARSSTSREVGRMGDCCWPIFDRIFPKCMFQFTSEAALGAKLWRARTFCYKVCTHKAFEYTILGFIFASSLSLCLQDATLVEGSTLDEVLTYMDYIYLGVFTIELMIKMFAFGIRTYMTSSWTILDFIIVTTGYIDLGMSLGATSVNLSSLRALRTLRALRPLRAISRWQGMKIVVSALMTAIPGIANVLTVVMIIWLIFAIMGVQFFSGKFWMCIDVNTGNRVPRALAPNRVACANNTDWVWTTYYINFDNVANAYLALLQMATFEGWTFIYELSVDSPEQIGDQPAPELNLNYYVYYVVFIILCSFFLLNLFVGVIIDDFNALKKKYEGGTALLLFMTDSQKQYYSTVKQLGTRKPKKAIVRPENPFLAIMFNIANSQRFEYAIAVVIFSNVILMTTEHFNQDDFYVLSQDMLNVVFTTIFAMEAILKLSGLRLNYFRVAWNVFDFTVVIVSILGIAFNDLLIANNVSPSIMRLFRVLRLGRIIRLFRAWKGVRKLMLSFIMSLPALFNIVCLLFLIMFIYAVIGINLFGHVGTFGGNLDDIANFHTFPVALFTLFRLTTVSGWDNVHQGLSFTDDPASGCNPRCSVPTCNPCCNRTYWTRPNGEIVWEKGGDSWGNCGNFPLACIYVISYLLLTYFVIVNMFAAVILDNYQQATRQEDAGVTDDDIEHFYTVWEQYDPLATQFIKFDDLSNFLAALDAPLGLPKPNERALTLLDFPIVKDQSTGVEIIHCLDVLMGVVRKALGFMDESEDFSQVKDNLESVFKSSFPNRIQIQVVSSTKQRKKEDVAARTIQKNWRKHLASRQYREAVASKKQPSPQQQQPFMNSPTPPITPPPPLSPQVKAPDFFSTQGGLLAPPKKKF